MSEQATNLVKKTKKMNNAVEFWRIIFTFGVAYFHFNLFCTVVTRGLVPGVDFNPIMTGGWCLGFFLYLTGYFMMTHYMRRAETIDPKEAGRYAWGYFWGRVKGLLPALGLGTLFVFIARNIAIGTPWYEIPVYLMRALWEFFGLYQLGLSGYNDPTNNQALIDILGGPSPSGIRAGFSTDVATPLWNGPGWYISAIIIASVLVYFVLCKNKDFFLGFFCPIMIVGGYGFMGLASGVEWVRPSTSFLGLPTNIIRVTAGICVGCLMYFVVQWIKEKKIPQEYKVLWNVFSIVVAAFLVYTMWFGVEWIENQHQVFVIALTVVVLVGEDALSHLLNNAFSALMGKLSLYFYVTHWGWIFLLPIMFPDMGYLPMALVFLILSFASATVCMLIDTKLIKPMLAKTREGNYAGPMAIVCGALIVVAVAVILTMGMPEQGHYFEDKVTPTEQTEEVVSSESTESTEKSAESTESAEESAESAPATANAQ